MANIPTESRIFANRYLREARALEAKHAGKISPGTTTWFEAMHALMTRLENKKLGPVQCAKIVGTAVNYLHDGVEKSEKMHVILASHTAKRSASLVVMTISAGHHPFDDKEEGLNLLLHLIQTQRNGNVAMLTSLDLAFVSKHAISRLHQRGDDLNNRNTTGVLAFIGVLGHLTRYSKKHTNGGLCLHFGDTVLVGLLRHAKRQISENRIVDATFYDVRTALSADMMINNAMIEQGRVACEAVRAWFKSDRSDEFEASLADAIPFLPGRYDDYQSIQREERLTALLSSKEQTL